MSTEHMLTVEPIAPPTVFIKSTRAARANARYKCLAKVVLTIVALASFVVASLPFIVTYSKKAKPLYAKEKASSGAIVHSYFLLDRSGSMASLTNAVKQGFATYVSEQQAQPGTMYLTVAQFDSKAPFEVIIESQDIHSASRRLDEFAPRSMTPLYDAIERMIALAEATSHGSDEVIIVIFTDGAENASKEATRESVFAKIESKKKRGWSFVFLGANQDSFATGRSINVASGSVRNYTPTPQGVDYGWGTISKAMSAQRSYRSRSDYTAAARAAQASNFFDAAAGAKAAAATAAAK